MTSAPPDPPRRAASCLCGQLSFVVRGEPVHLHGCTCTRCQRKSGSVMLLSGWFPQEAVDIVGTYTVHLPDPSAPGHMRGFCPTCGTGHFFRSGDYLPGTIAISIGSFADPGFPPPGYIHWWPDRPRWLAPPTGPVLLDGN